MNSYSKDPLHEVRKFVLRYGTCKKQNLLELEINTATTKPYIAIMPAITTGISAFMINSGRKTPIPAIDAPLFAVPYAAPIAIRG